MAGVLASVLAGSVAGVLVGSVVSILAGILVGITAGVLGGRMAGVLVGSVVGVLLASLFLRRADRDRIAFSRAPKLIVVEAAATAAYVGLGAIRSFFARRQH